MASSSSQKKKDQVHLNQFRIFATQCLQKYDIFPDGIEDVDIDWTTFDKAVKFEMIV